MPAQQQQQQPRWRVRTVRVRGEMPLRATVALEYKQRGIAVSLSALLFRFSARRWRVPRARREPLHELGGGGPLRRPADSAAAEGSLEGGVLGG